MAEPSPPPTPPTAASLRIDRSAPRRRRGGWTPWLLGLGVLAAVALVAGRFLGQAAGILGGSEVREGRAVRLSPDAAAERTVASGYVVARTRAAISAREPGKLVKLYVDVGDRVEKGALLAELEHAEQDAAVERWEGEVARAKGDLEAAARSSTERGAAREKARRDTVVAAAAGREAEAWLEETRRDAARQQELFNRGVAATAERDRAATAARMAEAAAERARAGRESAAAEEERAAGDEKVAGARVQAAEGALASAEAGLREAKARREIAFLRAPFAGVVLRKEAEVGEVIAPVTRGDSLTRGAAVSLADFETLEMEVDVSERDLARVEAGAPCRIVLDAYPDDPFPGHVRQVVPTADRQKATVQVKVAFDRPDRRVLPEMGGKAVFLAAGTKVAGGADRVLVPAGALTERGGRRGVLLLDRQGQEERVRFASVETGERDGDQVVVKSGLAGGERVVLDPPAGLEDGARVTVRPGP